MHLFAGRIEDWLRVIRGEFEETPNLRLTLSEATRRWELEEALVAAVLDALVDVGFLHTGEDGAYVRRRAPEWVPD